MKIVKSRIILILLACLLMTLWLSTAVKFEPAEGFEDRTQENPKPTSVEDDIVENKTELDKIPPLPETKPFTSDNTIGSKLGLNSDDKTHLQDITKKVFTNIGALASQQIGRLFGEGFENMGSIQYASYV